MTAAAHEQAVHIPTMVNVTMGPDQLRSTVLLGLMSRIVVRQLKLAAEPAAVRPSLPTVGDILGT